MWLFWTLVAGCGDLAEAKRPAAAAPALSPEAKEAMAAYEAAATGVMTALRAVDLPAVQQAIWDGGAKGAALQAKHDALRAERDAAEQALMTANQRVAAAAGDPTGIRAAVAELGVAGQGLGDLAARARALLDEVTAATAPPATVTLAELATMDLLDLQRVMKAKGWWKPDAAVGGLTVGAYESANFDVARDGAVLNVAVTRRAASPQADSGSMRAVPPKDLAARAAPGTAFRYAAASDVYVEIAPRDGGTAAQAAALLDAVFPAGG